MAASREDQGKMSVNMSALKCHKYGESKGYTIFLPVEKVYEVFDSLG